MMVLSRKKVQRKRFDRIMENIVEQVVALYEELLVGWRVYIWVNFSLIGYTYEKPDQKYAENSYM
jgi:hypothetical protein